MQNEALLVRNDTIEIRPHRWGWRVFEAAGVEPVFLEKRQAIEHFEKEKDHDYQHGYSTTKIAPEDIAWLRPGTSPVGRLGQVGPTYGFVVLGWYKKSNITSSTELRNIMIKLSKLVSDHGGNAISYDKFGTEMRFYFLRLEDKIYAAGKRGKGSTATAVYDFLWRISAR